MADSRPTLVYLYGPPAAGKLTIAEKLAAITGFRLFHNHLTVNALVPVFDFGTPAFADVLHRIRLDVFESAARAGIDVIFTNNSAWRGQDARQRFTTFAEETQRRVEAGGGTVRFVHITAPVEELERRLANDSRREHGKLLEVDQLRRLLAGFDWSPLHEDDLVIDTSATSPDHAARAVAAACAQPDG